MCEAFCEHLDLIMLGRVAQLVVIFLEDRSVFPNALREKLIDQGRKLFMSRTKRREVSKCVKAAPDFPPITMLLREFSRHLDELRHQRLTLFLGLNASNLEQRFGQNDL